MKISGPKGPDSPQPSVTPQPKRSEGPAFKEVLDGDAAKEAAPGGPVGEITARLRSGEVDATEAVRLLVEAVVRQRVGEATPAIKERMRAALQRYLEHDPVLAEKINQLGQGDED